MRRSACAWPWLVAAVGLLALACAPAGPPPPAPPEARSATPAATAGSFPALEQRKEELKAQAKQYLAQGQYREALAVLQQARIFAGQPDPELDQLIAQA